MVPPVPGTSCCVSPCDLDSPLDTCSASEVVIPNVDTVFVFVFVSVVGMECVVVCGDVVGRCIRPLFVKVWVLVPRPFTRLDF